MSFEETLAQALDRALVPVLAELARLRAKLDERAAEKPAGQLMTLADAAKALGVSKRHLSALRSDGAFPVVRLGKRAVRVDLAAVRAALEASSRTTGPTDEEIIAAAKAAASPGKQT